jgi:putative copper export protein
MLDALAAFLKALLYAGLLSCAGVVFAAVTLRSSAEIAHACVRIMRRGAIVAVSAAIAGALLLIARLGGQVDEVTLSAVFLSSSGAALCLQLTGAGLLLAAPDDPTAHLTRLSNAAIALLSFAFNGHAAVVGLTEGLVAFVHASAAAWWLGSLWLLQDACTQRERALVVKLVARFSAIASGLIGALAIAGLILIGVLVDFARVPPLGAYEQILAVKIVIVSGALGIAAYNRLRLTPRLLTGDSTAVPLLLRTIRVELFIIGVVLITTAILTTYTSPHE